MRLDAPNGRGRRTAFHRIALAGLVLLAIGSSSCSAPTRSKRETTRVHEGPGDTVVLVHGLRWWSLGGMSWMSRQLNRHGYRVVEVRYPSRQLDCDVLVRNYVAPAVGEHNTHRDAPIHFIGHSMGGALSHRFLEENPPPNLGRCVFIGIPYHGTPLADVLAKKLPWSLPIIGPAVASLNTTTDGWTTRLQPPEFPVGVIMGDRSNYPFFSPFIPGADDGVVPVRSGRFEGTADFLMLHEAHIQMLKSRDVLEQSVRFLESGAFDHSKPVPRKRRIKLGRPGAMP